MDIERHSDAAAFRALVEPFLLEDEARHNLLLGLLTTLVEHPDVYPEYHLWIVRDGDAIAGVGLRTPPHMLVLAAPRTRGALEVLSAAIVEEGMELPGVVGGLPEADLFVACHARAAGCVVRDRMEQGIYALGAVDPVPAPAGSPRSATPADLDVVAEWIQAFQADVSPVDDFDEQELRRRIEKRLGGPGDSRYRIWEDGEPVCLVGFASSTPTGMRVGPVFTPAAKRGRGYATALVAEVSREILAGGRNFCFLYTDMANPTSNAIYRRIGYRLHSASAMIRFA